MSKHQHIFKNKKIRVLSIVLLLIVIAVGTLLGAPQSSQSSGSRPMAYFFGMLQSTIVYGVYYALLALGFALIFGAARIVNLYHGSFYLLGAYFYATFAKPHTFKFPTWAFWFFQLIIIAGLVFSGIRIYKDRSVKKFKTSKKISLPVGILLLGQIPLLLLFLKVQVTTVFNLNLIIALLFSIGFVGVLSLLINRFLIEPVRSEGVTVLIITIALAFFTERLIEAIFGSSAIASPSFISSKAKAIPLLFGQNIDPRRLLMVFVGIGLIIIIWLVMNKTKTGKGILAVAQDKEAATLMGVNPKFVYSLAIALSGILAAVAGVFTTPFLGDAAPEIWFSPLIKAFAIVILGGLGSIFGSVAAAFILSFVEKFTKYYISGSLEEVVFLFVIILILVVRPQGLFGKKGRF